MQLTKREKEVVVLVAQGETNKSIAEHLGISRRTVEAHRQKLSGKLGIHGTSKLTKYVVENGLDRKQPVSEIERTMKKPEELTIAEAKDLIAQADKLREVFGIPSSSATAGIGGSHSFKEGESVFIRCVTHYYTGQVVRVTDSDVVLSNAAWIADGGRFFNMLKSGFGDKAEIEPYPNGCVVSRGAIVDWCVWGHKLPKKQQ